MSVPDVKMSHLQKKSISKLATRLAKLYDIPNGKDCSDICLNIAYNIQYVFERGIQYMCLDIAYKFKSCIPEVIIKIK